MITVKAQFMIHHDLSSDSGLGKDVIYLEVNEGSNVGNLLQEMSDRYGQLFTQKIYNPQTKTLHDMIMITVNGSLLHTLSGMDTVLHQGDLIVFLPLIMGG